MLVIQATVWPYGYEPGPDDDPILSVIVVNDGTGTGGGNEGGTGNYDVYEGDPRTVRTRDYPETCWRHLGRIEGVSRTPGHRAELVRRALALL